MKVITKACFYILLGLFTTSVSIKDSKETQEDFSKLSHLKCDNFLSQLLDPASGLLDEDTAELLRTTCSVDLIQLKEEIGDLESCFPEESSSSCANEISSDIQSLAQYKIQKLIDACHPQLKQIFLHCLRKNNLPHHGVYGDGDVNSNVWHAAYIKSFQATRRNLGQLPQSISKSSGYGPAIKSYIRAQQPEGAHKKSDSPAIIAAAAASAAVTLVVVLLCVFCFCRPSQVGRNDERPLLSMSRSDQSIGYSSQYASGNSVSDENFGFQSHCNNSVDHKRNSSLNGNFPVECNVQEILSPGPIDVAAGRPSLDLPPPPGRVGTSPLKPPPGRPDLPTKPPSAKHSDIAVVDAAAAPPPPPPPPPAKTATGPPPPPPPALPGAKKGPGAPPPPSKSGAPRPPGPPPLGPKVGRPLAIGRKSKSSEAAGGADSKDDAASSKAKLKPFFWDKVQANSEQSMVWSQLKAGSFQFDEEMMESLFGYTNPEKTKPVKKRTSSMDSTPQLIQIIDAKKSQNLSILLRALNVTLEEVSEAILEGNELPSEFLQSLLKMAPTSEEELKLRLFSGNVAQLSPADRFLKALVETPLAFKRLEALLFMGTVQEELTSTRESFATLEVACNELRSSRLFLKLLEAVLKTGNRMNDGTFRGGAQAFKLDTLLKLSDVKGVDGKTTLLHFVVKEIIRTEGIRAFRRSKESKSFSSIKTEDLLEEVVMESEERYSDLGLQVVSRLSSELENVKKAAAIDADSLTGTTSKLGHGLLKTKDLLNNELKEIEPKCRGGFYQTLESFVETVEKDITNLLEEEKKIADLVKCTGDYFHGNSGRDEGLRLFVVVRDFLIMLDKVCKEVGDAQKKAAASATKPSPKHEPPTPSTTKPPPKHETPTPPAAKPPNKHEPPNRPLPPPDRRQQLFPVIIDRRVSDSSSDSDSDDESP